MARELLTIGGAIVGSFFGQPQIGFMIGSLVGNIVDPQVIKGPKLNLSPQTSRDGVIRPRVFGRTMVSGNVIDRGEPVIKKKRKRQGKGGPVVETQHVYMTYAIRICEGEIDGVSRIWEDDKLVYDVTDTSEILADSAEFAEKFVLYVGSETQTVDPDLEIVHGVGTTPRHKGTAYIVCGNRDLTDFGGRIPQTRFEVNRGQVDATAESIAGDLVSWYEFEDDLTDSHGGNDLTNASSFGEPAAYIDGFRNRATRMRRYGSSYSDHYRDTSPSGLSSGAFTIGGWFRMQELTNGGFLFRTGSASGTDDGASLAFESGEFRGRLNSGADFTAAGSAVSANVWHFLVLARDSSNNVRFWVDGDPKVVTAGTGIGTTTGSFATALNISAISMVRGDANMPLFDADDCFILDGGVNQTQVDYLYNGGLGRSYASMIGTGGSSSYGLDDIVTELCDLVDVPAGDIDVTDLTDTVDGFLVQGDSVRDNIQALQRAYFFDASEFDGKINFIKRGGASVVSIPEDDLLTDAEEIGREQELEFPKKLHLYYHNPVQSYVPTKATSERASPDIRVLGEASIELPINMDAATAAQKSDILHKIQWIDLIGEVKFKLPELKYAYLVPSNIVTVTIRGKARRVRIEKLECAGGIMSVTARHDRASAYTSTVTGATIRDPLTPTSTIPGESLFAMLNINAIMDSDDQLGYRVATGGTKAAWAGTVVQRSIDAGSNYATVATITNGAVMGQLTASLPDASAYFTDNTNTLSVELLTFDDELETITDTQLLQDYNAAVITDGTNYEIVQFKTATYDSGTTWDLTTLLRGRANTEPRTWDIGDTFALLETTDFIPVNSGLMGQEFTHRSVAMGTTEASATEYTETFDPINSCREWAPEYLTLARDGGDVITGEWIPRWRVGTSINPVQSVNFIGWRVTLDDGVLDAVTFDVTTPEFSYDASALGSPLTVSVAGINRFTGAGDTASDTV